MAAPTLHPSEEVVALGARQHWVLTREQLLGAGLSPGAVRHLVSARRLYPVRRGIYAVGRPRLSPHGLWMAAVLSCGDRAVLSGPSAAMLWQLVRFRRAAIEVSIPPASARRPRGVIVGRRLIDGRDRVANAGIPVTSPARTLLDLATGLARDPLEAAINEADRRDLIDPEALRAELARFAGLPGVRALRDVLDRRTFTLSDSELERRFRPIARRAGLPLPKTGRRVNGFQVDFFWPDLRLVVETDGLRYHRTPAQQARDRLRDQAHAAAGLTPLRFTRAQVRYEQAHVEAVLAAVANRLKG